MNINKFRKTIRNKRKTLKKKGGVQPPSTPERPRLTRTPPPPLPGTPTVLTGRQFPSISLSIDWNTATSALLEISNRNSGEYLYQNSEDYINAAFNIITDIVTVQRIINDVRSDNLLDELFTDYILPNFRFAINNNIEHWNTISRHLNTGRTGNIIELLRDQSGRYAPREGYSFPDEIYRNGIIEIARLNPNRMDIDGGMQRKPRKTKKKTLKKKGGGIQEIKKFLHYIVNNTYPEDVEHDDNIQFGYKKDDLKYIKPLDMITLDDLDLLALEITKSIEFEQELMLRRINRLHKFKLHILKIINSFESNIHEIEFPDYTRGDSFNTPPASRPRTAPNVVRPSRFANTRRPSPIQLSDLDNNS